MVKKILYVFSVLSASIACFTAYADPLDPQNFKEGTYVGKYSGTGSWSNCTGPATLVIDAGSTKYTTGNGSGSQVSFTGTLKFSGVPCGDPNPSAFSVNGVAVKGFIQGPSNGTDNSTYASSIFQSDGYDWCAPNGYYPSAHRIQAQTTTNVTRMSFYVDASNQ